MRASAQREAVAQALATALKRATGIALPRAVKNLAWAMDAADEIIAAHEAAGNVPTHRHRNGGLYRLIGYGNHTESNETFAVYADSNGVLWCRPTAAFHDGRFTPIDPPKGPSP